MTKILRLQNKEWSVNQKGEVALSTAWVCGESIAGYANKCSTADDLISGAWWSCYLNIRIIHLQCSSIIFTG